MSSGSGIRVSPGTLRTALRGIRPTTFIVFPHLKVLLHILWVQAQGMSSHCWRTVKGVGSHLADHVVGAIEIGLNSSSIAGSEQAAPYPGAPVGLTLAKWVPRPRTPISLG